MVCNAVKQLPLALRYRNIQTHKCTLTAHYRGVTPAAVADTLFLVCVKVIDLCVICVANKAELHRILFLLPALGHHIQALTNADATHIVCVCVCACVYLCLVCDCVVCDARCVGVSARV